MTLSDKQVNDTTEPTGDASPVGFCPYCDYQLVAVGTCPECGKAVIAASIRSQPRGFLFRKWSKRLFFLTVMAGVCYGGWRFYRSDVWLRTLSVERLTSWASTFPRARSELLRRNWAGQLTVTDKQHVVRSLFQIECDVIEPRPRDLPLLIRYTPGRKLLHAWCQAHISMTGLAIDGKNITSLPEPMDYVFNLYNFTNRHNPEIYPMEFVSDGPLSVGAHTVVAKFEVEMRFGSHQDFDDQTLANLSKPFTLQRTVQRDLVVVGQSAAELVIPAITDGELDDLVGAVTISLAIDKEDNAVLIRPHGRPNFALIGRFALFKIGEVSPFFSAPYRQLDYHWRQRAVVSRGHARGYLKNANIEAGETVRMRFIPEPAAQYDDGYESCFPLVLEWDAISPFSFDSGGEAAMVWRVLRNEAPKFKPDRGIRWVDFQDAAP